MTKTNMAAQQELKLGVESSPLLCQAVTWPRPDFHRGDRGWIPVQSIWNLCWTKWLCDSMFSKCTPTPRPNRSNMPIDFFHHRRCIISANYSVVTYDTKKINWSKFETFVLPSCYVARRVGLLTFRDGV